MSSHFGCLFRYTCGPTGLVPFDPNKPTIVITHGWNPLPGRIRLTTPHAFARAICCRYGDQVNVLGWDWNQATFPSLSCRYNSLNAMCQGKQLACELQRLGARPERTWLIGHSLGALVMASAAQKLAAGGTCVARLSLLDAVCSHHRFIFCQMRAHCHARCIENYWAALPSGVGGPARWPGVYNRWVPGRTPIRGVLNPLRGNHVHVIDWYYQTICNPSMPDGFNR